MSTSGQTKGTVNQDAGSLGAVTTVQYYTISAAFQAPVNTNLILATPIVNLIRLRRVPTVLIWDIMQIVAIEEETSA